MDTLKVTERDGRKPNQLREAGLTPVALVERGKETRKLQAHAATLSAALTKAHDARVLELQVEGEDQKKTVFIKQIDHRPHNPEILTVTLCTVNKSELMTVEVPITAVGTPIAVLQGNGVLVNTTSTIRITGNYSNLPAGIEVDTSGLDLNASIHAGDIALPKGTELACPADTTMFKLQVLRGSEKPEVTETPETGTPAA